jgi:lipopolysaccharide/colanic/teichoic acid biosynthesis glycosyltransferase
MKFDNLRKWIWVADSAWVAVAMALAYLLRYGWAWDGPPGRSAALFLLPLLVAVLVWSWLSSRLQLDGFRGGWRFSAVVSQLLSAVSLLMMSLLVGGYLARQYVSRLLLGYFGLLLLAGFVLIRFATWSVFRSRYRKGAVRRVVIVGNGSLAREMAVKIELHPESLYHVVGFLCPAGTAFDAPLPGAGTEAVNVQSLGIVDLLQAHDVNEVILTIPQTSHPEVLDLVALCRRRGIAVSLVPQPYLLYLSKPELVDLGGLPLLQLKDVATRMTANPIWKRVLDLVLAPCLSLLSLPAILIAAAVLKHLKGQGFCRELRCGQHGKPFWIYRLNSERNGSGLTRAESVMQQLSLTELPQLLNVLRGDMSLVGPRPEGLDRARRYTDWHRQRLSAKPGMTGLAQVHGLRHHNSSEDKTRYDLQYIMHRSVFQDISLMLQTLWTLMGRVLQLRKVPATPVEPSGESFFEPVFEESLHRAHSAQSSSD